VVTPIEVLIKVPRPAETSISSRLASRRWHGDILQKATQGGSGKDEIRSRKKAGLYSLPAVSKHVVLQRRPAYRVFDLLSAFHLAL
jgi:hypothetical protein